MSHHTPELLKVDVGAVTTSQELHNLLAETFQFPDYYGRNWDAFDECIRDVQLPPRVEIVGLETLHSRLKRGFSGALLILLRRVPAIAL